MIHHFEAIGTCFEYLAKRTVFWQNIRRDAVWYLVTTATKVSVRETALGPSSGGVLRGQGEEQPCMLNKKVTVLSRASPYLLPTPAQALGHGRFICCAARAAPHGPPWPSSARFNIYRYGGTEKFHCGAQTLLLLSIIHVRNTLFLQFSP